MTVEIVLYILILDKITRQYYILSEHPDRFEECSSIVNTLQDLESQVHDLYYKYLELHHDYIRFIHLRPFIDTGNNKLKIPFYCLVPYHDFKIKNSYKLLCTHYAKFIPALQKVLNGL